MKKVTFFLALSCLVFIFQSNATHIKGGEITYRITNPSTRTVEFKLSIYRDMTGVDQPNATMYFGDGTSCVTVPVNTPREQIDPETEVLNYIFTHSYAGDGAYTVSFNEENRNPEIANINDGNSVLISFYIDAYIVLNAQTTNNSFKYFERPFFVAKSNALFSHTITGNDPEADSLYFQLVTPQAYYKGSGGCASGAKFPVPTYKYPDDIKINPFSGNITWTPTKAGTYAFSVKVTEYRNNVMVGYTIRDFQIHVKDTEFGKTMALSADAKIKEFNVIDIGVDKPLEIVVRYVDPTATSIKLEAHFESLPNDKVSFQVTDSANYKIGKFKLATDASLVRYNPYIITFTGTSIKGGIFHPLKIATSFVLNFIPGKVFSTNPPVVLGVNDDFDKAAMVYPNPAGQAFSVNSTTHFNAKIDLYNAQGQKVFSQKLSDYQSTKINRLSLPKGIYIYRIMSKGTIKESGRIVFE